MSGNRASMKASREVICPSIGIVGEP